MYNQPITSELTDKNIRSAFPQIDVADSTGKYPTIVYNHRKVADEDGNETFRVGTCRLAHKMDGSPYLLRKSFVCQPDELGSYELGSVYSRDLFLFETTLETISGGELAVDQTTNEPFLSGGKKVKRFFMFGGDQIGITEELEILPGLVTQVVKQVALPLTQDLRVGYDARPRAKNTSTEKKPNALGAELGKSKI